MSPGILWHYAPSLVSGFGVTIMCWGVGGALGMAIGFAIALAIRLPFPPLRWLLRAFIEVFRGTPFLLQLFLLYAGGPYIGLKLSATTAGILGLGLYSSAYFAEIFRAGFAAVPVGQIEAATSVGMKPFDTLRRVTLPAALIAAVPPIVNMLIVLVEGDGGALDHHRARTHVSGADDGGGDLHRLRCDLRHGGLLLATRRNRVASRRSRVEARVTAFLAPKERAHERADDRDSRRGKGFGAHEVLRGVDLSVERSEVVCLIGPSGSGKSTLLRCVNFLESYDAARCASTAS